MASLHSSSQASRICFSEFRDQCSGIISGEDHHWYRQDETNHRAHGLNVYGCTHSLKEIRSTQTLNPAYPITLSVIYHIGVITHPEKKGWRRFWKAFGVSIVAKSMNEWGNGVVASSVASYLWRGLATPGMGIDPLAVDKRLWGKNFEMQLQCSEMECSKDMDMTCARLQIRCVSGGDIYVSSFSAAGGCGISRCHSFFFFFSLIAIAMGAGNVDGVSFRFVTCNCVYIWVPARLYSWKRCVHQTRYIHMNKQWQQHNMIAYASIGPRDALFQSCVWIGLSGFHSHSSISSWPRRWSFHSRDIDIYLEDPSLLYCWFHIISYRIVSYL